MEDTEDLRTTVELYIYELTKGMAAMMSPILIGKHKTMLINYILGDGSITIYWSMRCYTFRNIKYII